MVVVKVDRAQLLPAPLARVERGDGVDHRPAEARQEAQAAGEVRDREVDHVRVLPRLPGDDGLDRELRASSGSARGSARARPWEIEELGGLRAPRDEERGTDHRRERPERGQSESAGARSSTMARRAELARRTSSGAGYSMPFMGAIESPSNPLIREIARALGRAHAPPSRGREADPRRRRRGDLARSRPPRRERAPRGASRVADGDASPARLARRPRAAGGLAHAPASARGRAAARRPDGGDPRPSRTRRLRLRNPGPGQPRRRSCASPRRPGPRASSARRARPTSSIRGPCAAAPAACCGSPCPGESRSSPSRPPPGRTGRAICGAVSEGGENPFDSPPPERVGPRHRSGGDGPSGGRLPLPRPPSHDPDAAARRLAERRRGRGAPALLARVFFLPSRARRGLTGLVAPLDRMRPRDRHLRAPLPSPRPPGRDDLLLTVSGRAFRHRETPSSSENTSA